MASARALLHLGLVAAAAAHGSLVRPPSRNALLDRALPAFAGGKAPLTSCNCGDAKAGCSEGTRAPSGGQPCFWFSQGCFIGCRLCTGTDRQGDGMPLNVSSGGGDCSGARGGLSTQPAGFSAQPTLPRRLWTMNRNAGEDTPHDVYRFHPFRAPGSAPVSDPCGTAGGTGPAHSGPGEAIFSPVRTLNGTTIAQGALGSKVLPRGPPTATWKVNSVNATAVEVSWALRFNHGGGYQYRLCSASETLTEDCFQRTPLDFVRTAVALELKNGTRIPIANTSAVQYIDEGVIPVGATWARNPIPFISGHAGCESSSSGNGTDTAGRPCRQFDPPCKGAESGWGRTPGSDDPTDTMGECSGNWVDGMIVDQILIPPGLPLGPYVLGLRWDGEQTSQVWGSCADVELAR